MNGTNEPSRPTAHAEASRPGSAYEMEDAMAAAVLAGVSLSYDRGLFRVDVVDESGATFLSLGPYAEEEVMSVWRSLSAASGLPLLATGPRGGLTELYPQLGRLVLGAKPDPRRLAVLSGRRPRFLARRKAGKLSARPVIYREPELAGEGQP